MTTNSSFLTLRPQPQSPGASTSSPAHVVTVLEPYIVGPELDVLNLVLTVTSGVVVGLRIHQQYARGASRLWWDDYIAIVSWVSIPTYSHLAYHAEADICIDILINLPSSPDTPGRDIRHALASDAQQPRSWPQPCRQRRLDPRHRSHVSGQNRPRHDASGEKNPPLALACRAAWVQLGPRRHLGRPRPGELSIGRCRGPRLDPVRARQGGQEEDEL